MPCIIPLLMQYVVDHARAIDIIKVVIKTVDRLLCRKEGEDMDLITYVTDRKSHDMLYAIDSRKLQKELGWEPSLQFEEGIEETVKWYLFSKTYPSFLTVKEGSTSHLGLLPSGKKRETALLGARNRCAIRVADQSGLRHVMRTGTVWDTLYLSSKKCEDAIFKILVS